VTAPVLIDSPERATDNPPGREATLRSPQLKREAGVSVLHRSLQATTCITALLLAAACGREDSAPKPTSAPSAKTAPTASAAAPAAQKKAPGKKPARQVATTGHPNLPGFVRPSGPVASVNGRAIAASRFNAEFDRLIGTGARVPRDRLKHIARNILSKLIERELRHQAIVKENVTLSETEFNAAYDEYKKRFVDAEGRFNASQFKANLERSRMTREQLETQIREQRLARKLVDKIGKLEVSTEEGQRFYNNNPSAWVENESRDVRPIMLRVGPEAPAEDKTAARSKAQEAYEALSKGEDFERVSKRVSGAVLAPIHLTRSSAEQELTRAAFKLKVGEISKPVKTRWGWYVLRLVEKNDQRVRPFAEVEAEIRKTLRARKFYLEDRRIVQELRSAAEIEEKLPF